MKHWGAAALALVAIVSCPRTVGADERVPPRVAVSLPRCDALAFDPQAFIELLRIELGADGVGSVSVEPKADDASQQNPPLARVAVDVLSCSRDDGHMVITVFDRLTDKSVGRGLDLAQTDPKARARFLALAVAELVRASWLELTARRQQVVPASVLLAATAARVSTFVKPREMTATEPSTRALPGSWLGVGASVRTFPAAQAALLGPVVGVSTRVASSEVAFAGRASFGEAYDPLGSVSLGLASGAVAWMFSTTSDPIAIAVGPRIEAGYGWVRGDAANAGTRTDSGGAGILLLGATASVRGRISARWASTLAIDGGLSAVGLDATADGRRTTGIRGPFVGATIGVELVP